MGINPATGAAITLKARPEEHAPKMAFSRLLKDRVRQLSIPGPVPGPERSP